MVVKKEDKTINLLDIAHDILYNTIIPQLSIKSIKKSIKKYPQDFSGGPAVKGPPANAEDVGSIPGLGRSHLHGATRLTCHNY